MFKHFLICALGAALPVGISAQEARSTKTVNLRAGPDRDYPLVARFGPGTPLIVQGCTDGFFWCDVIAPSDIRGWIYAGNIAYPYQSANVPVIRYGAVIGFPVVTFVIGSYWGNYYRNRPWYGNQANWGHHRPPPRPRPPVFRPPQPQIQPPRDSRPRPQVQPPHSPRPPGNNRPAPSVQPPIGDRPGAGGRSEGGGPRAPQPR